MLFGSLLPVNLLPYMAKGALKMKFKVTDLKTGRLSWIILVGCKCGKCRQRYAVLEKDLGEI